MWRISKNKLTIKKAKCSPYRPGVAQRVGRGLALLFHYFGTRRDQRINYQRNSG
jgi:hypothetical protein